MPQTGSYGSQRRSPATLVTVAMLHAGVAAAVLLTPGVIPRRIPDPPLKVGNYIDPPPPPPASPPPEHHATPKTPETHIDTPPPLSPMPPVTGPTFPPSPPLPQPPAIDPGPATPPPPPPAAVLKDPTIDPRYAGAFQPSYPSALMREGVEGKAVVRVLIGVDGRVKALEAVSATDPLFLEATRRQALAHWRFLPATRDGVPVESWRTMTVRFQMNA